jgi:ribosomal protein S18 acetylase RimI-like enzyme
MPQRDLDWRIEEACCNAWPAQRQVWLGDWLLRFAPGVSRRANSANPLRAGASDVDALVAAGTPLYAAQSLPMLVRVLSLLDPAVDRRLDALGFTAEGETLVLHGDIGAVARKPDPDVTIEPQPSPAWQAPNRAMLGLGAFEDAVYRRIVTSIALPAAFLSLHVDGKPAALAFGALHDGLLVCESVITDAAHRGRGYSRRLMAAMFDWAAALGADGVCLQVQADNDPAVRLYNSLGLTTERFRYWYRRAPG